ncbi:hypothetical protein [Nocardioides piscis]|uniref:Sulfotransferase family protein n=1 Tax=Nocardioides piscis TaxID=2714938 RepID=A0A6G7YG95_9ACTN|nr:hypothetical protein [Nocardioides piscis]QIK75627.1 hypothetical protein G7071_09395 [Nocardioides piscis]
MAERVVLHIGSMKSGTSFIQNVLGNNREALAQHGITFAGERWRDQVAAVQDLIAHGGPRQAALDPEGPWQSLVDEINATPGTAVVSMEFLAPRVTRKIEIIRDGLQGRLEVVLTGRDLARNLAAMWLESVQNGSAVTWDDYLAAVRSEDGKSPVARNFWNHQGLAAIARRWSDVVGAEHFTLMTVPPKGAPSDLLWQRFATVLQLDPDAFELDVRANRSIGLATALTLRQLNELLGRGGTPAADHKFYDLLVKHLLAKRSLAARAGEPTLGVDERWVMKRGAAEVTALRKQGHRVIGDLDELQPRPVRGIHPDQVSTQTQLEAAMDGLTRMTELSMEREAMHRQRLRRAKKRRKA